MTPTNRARLALVVATAACGAAVALAGCGTSSARGDKIGGERLTIYASVPLHGASSVGGMAVLRGAELALDSVHARVGSYRIAFKDLDDSTVQSGGWDPGQTTANARLAILDKTTIGYIGEYNSGASAVSIPLLNRTGIPQISPSSTAVGLTAGGPQAGPGEPGKYYPTGRRTFARVVPSDAVQASVLARLARSSGCSRTYVLDDDEVDGRDLAESFQVAARAAGLTVVGSQEFEPKATDFSSLATSVAQSGADCVVLGAITKDNVALATRQVAAALPQAKFFGSAGLAQSTFVNPALGGIPLSLDARVLITVATLDPAAYPPPGRRFFALYERRYGAPQPYAIFGYEAMSLMLDAIARATRDGNSAALRSNVLDAIFATRDRRSVLGAYSIDGDGDTTLARYGVYTVGNGQLHFWKAMRG
ncbi:MAG: branched-chain amino acid ABC transporter substrate-binding protein [Solirubrobacteraceae bacterium]